MGHVGRELPLRLERGLKTGQHLVHGISQLVQLISPSVCLDSLAQIAAGSNGSGRLRHLRYQPERLPGNPEAAESRQNEGSLKPDDFIIIKANWDNKDRNIEAIAAGLNIGQDALVFLDDNPAERAIVSAQLPTVAVPEMERPEDYIRVVDRSRFFEITAFSSDDLKRNEMYKENAVRAAQQAQFTDYGEYLHSLEMVAVIDDFLPVYLPRITQLTNKSNQFNLTTKRFTTAEMEQVFADDSYIRLYGRLADKFGDNGIVSVVIGKVNGDTLDIDLWLMSCRVLKRDMEYAMLDNLCDRAKQRGLKTVKGYYYPTAKNKMVKELYGDFGFTKVSEDADGNTVWELSLSGYKPKNKYITVERNK